MFKIQKKMCNQCLFSPNKIVSDERKAEIIEECLKRDSFFVCHKASLIDEVACCAGFWHEYRRDVLDLRIVQALNGGKFVTIN